LINNDKIQVMKKLYLLALLMIAANFSMAQWQPDVRLTNAAGKSFPANSNARAIVASGDTLHVVWYDNRTTYFEIYYKRSTDGALPGKQIHS